MQHFDDGPKYDSLAVVDSFEDFTETVPGTSAAIRMIAIPGGEFTMGSSAKEPFHKDDEGPQKKVKISPFFMGEVEVTWRQFWAFYNETMSEGRTPPEKIYANNNRPDVDAVSGPTPPFGFPDQGWGIDLNVYQSFDRGSNHLDFTTYQERIRFYKAGISKKLTDGLFKVTYLFMNYLDLTDQYGRQQFREDTGRPLR